jgi:hypothetical protein
MKVLSKYYAKHYGFMLALTTLSVLTFAWGWKHSSNEDGMPFARSGALATAFLVAYVVWDYQKRFAQELDLIRSAIARAGNWTTASASARGELDAKITRLLACTMKLIAWWYAGLLLVSTLIWGFGDQFFLNMSDQQLTVLEALQKTISMRSK